MCECAPAMACFTEVGGVGCPSWILGAELRLSGFRCKCLYLPSPYFMLFCFFKRRGDRN